MKMNTSILSCQAEAEKLSSCGRLDEAAQLVLREVADAPTSDLLRVAASDFFRHIGDYQSSITQNQTASAIKPDNVNLMIRVIQDLVSLHRYDEAMVQADELRKYANHSGARSMVANINRIMDYCLNSPFLLKAWELSQLPIQNPRSPLPAAPSLEVQPFQYWSQGEPPSDVQACSRQWNSLLTSIGLPPILLFDKISAASWIASHAPDFELPFASAYHYAIESNVFRVAYASAGRDCMWIDSDMVPKPDATSILLSALSCPASLLFFREGSPWISNCFFVARNRCCFFQSLANQGRLADFSVFDQDTYPWGAPLRPPAYNSTLKSSLESGLDKVSISCPSSYLAVISIGGKQLSFCNERSFARMNPVGGLEYKQTSDAWQRRFGQS